MNATCARFEYVAMQTESDKLLKKKFNKFSSSHLFIPRGSINVIALLMR